MHGDHYLNTFLPQLEKLGKLVVDSPFRERGYRKGTAPVSSHMHFNLTSLPSQVPDLFATALSPSRPTNKRSLSVLTSGPQRHTDNLDHLQLPFIGDKLALKVVEIVKTGTIAHLLTPVSKINEAL